MNWILTKLKSAFERVFDWLEVDITEPFLSWFDYAFLNNNWLWFHILSGGLIAGFLDTELLLPGWGSVFIVLCLAIAWEMFENWTGDIERTYGTRARFYMDASGDIVGAVLNAWLVIYFLN